MELEFQFKVGFGFGVGCVGGVSGLVLFFFYPLLTSSPSTDPFLAKRYYDLSLSTNPASIYAVYISLAQLYIDHFIPQWWSSFSFASGVTSLISIDETVLIAILVCILGTLLFLRGIRRGQ